MTIDLTDPHTAGRFQTLVAVDEAAAHDGYFLGEHGTQPVDGCQICGIARRDHGKRYGIGGWHQWTEPGTWLRKVRMLSRRRLAEETARHRAEHDAMVAEMMSWQAMEAAAPKLRAEEIRADVHEVLVHGEWRPVTWIDNDIIDDKPSVWIGLGVGYSIGRKSADLVPARKIGDAQ